MAKDKLKINTLDFFPPVSAELYVKGKRVIQFEEKSEYPAEVYITSAKSDNEHKIIEN